MDICYECLKPMVKKHGNITLERLGCGSYTVIGVLHYACDCCGARVILPEEAERVEIEGVKTHILKALKSNNKLSILDLRGITKSNVYILECAIKKLAKEKVVNVDYTNVKLPIISLIKPNSFSFKALWNKLLNK